MDATPDPQADFKIVLQSVDVARVADLRREVSRTFDIEEEIAGDIVDAAPIAILTGLNVAEALLVRGRLGALAALGSTLLITDTLAASIPRVNWSEPPALTRASPDELLEALPPAMRVALEKAVVVPAHEPVPASDAAAPAPASESVENAPASPVAEPSQAGAAVAEVPGETPLVDASAGAPVGEATPPSGARAAMPSPESQKTWASGGEAPSVGGAFRCPSCGDSLVVQRSGARAPAARSDKGAREMRVPTEVVGSDTVKSEVVGTGTVRLERPPGAEEAVPPPTGPQWWEFRRGEPAAPGAVPAAAAAAVAATAAAGNPPSTARPAAHVPVPLPSVPPVRTGTLMLPVPAFAVEPGTPERLAADTKPGAPVFHDDDDLMSALPEKADPALHERVAAQTLPGVPVFSPDENATRARPAEPDVAPAEDAVPAAVAEAETAALSEPPAPAPAPAKDPGEESGEGDEADFDLDEALELLDRTLPAAGSGRKPAKLEADGEAGPDAPPPAPRRRRSAAEILPLDPNEALEILHSANVVPPVPADPFAWPAEPVSDELEPLDPTEALALLVQQKPPSPLPSIAPLAKRTGTETKVPAPLAAKKPEAKGAQGGGSYGLVLSKVTGEAKQKRGAEIVADVARIPVDEALKLMEQPIIKVLRGVSREEAVAALERFKKAKLAARVTTRKPREE